MDKNVRVSFLPNVNGEKGKNNQLNKVVLAALQELPSEKATEYVFSLLKDDSAAKQLDKKEKLELPVSAGEVVGYYGKLSWVTVFSLKLLRMSKLRNCL